VLTKQQGEFIESVIRAGEYTDVNEVIRDALRALQHRREKDALKLEALRTLIQVGSKALEREDFTEIDDADLDRFLAALTGMLKTREN
jgi:putative addiction module CopG family antidote